MADRSFFLWSPILGDSANGGVSHFFFGSRRRRHYIPSQSRREEDFGALRARSFAAFEQAQADLDRAVVWARSAKDLVSASLRLCDNFLWQSCAARR
jgi:hypothetical protein